MSDNEQATRATTLANGGRTGGGRLRRSLRRQVMAAVVASDDEDDESDSDEEEEREDEDDYEEEDSVVDAAAVEEEPLEGRAYEDLSALDVVFAKRLAAWMRCFSEAFIEWAIVDDRRSQGKERHGLVVTLTEDVALWDYKGDSKSLRLLRLREAIDLVRLVALVRPAVLKAEIRRLENRNNDADSKLSAYEDELNALTRGVPVEVRVVLNHGTLQALGLKQQLAIYFIQKLSETSSSNPDFVAVWTDLLAPLSDTLGLVKCNSLLQAPVRVSVLIDSCGFQGASERDSEQFFHNVGEFVKAVDTHQRTQKPKLWGLDIRHAQLHVDKIKLELRSLYVTARTCRRMKSLMHAGIPVECTYLSIDPRIIPRNRDIVQTFVGTIRQGELHVGTDTSLTPRTIDSHGQDETERIQIVMEAIASIDRAIEVNLGGLLKLCQVQRNREQIWRGLFDAVLSRDLPPNDLSFFHDVELKAGDVPVIRRCASRWREANPRKKLRLRSLHLVLMGAQSDAVVALLSAFDDVEQVSIEDNWIDPMHSPEVVLSALRYPSLRRLTLENVIVESMDLFDPSIRDERLPTKPVLEELDLQHILVRDMASVQRFVGKLAPNADGPHPLSTKLRRLTITQKNWTFRNGAIFDKGTVAAMRRVLMLNSTLECVEFNVDWRNDLVTEYRRHFRAENARHVRAQPEVCRREIVKARKFAFLSVIQDENVTEEARTALHLLDARVVQLIFELIAPYVNRQVQVGRSYEDDEEDEV